MTDDRIGSWAHRTGGKSHQVESRRGEPSRYVMHCGRELLDSEQKPLVFAAIPSWEAPACMQCSGDAWRRE